MDLSLNRIQRLLQLLNSPHLRYPVIHIAGTNGKGSVSAYISSTLTHASPSNRVLNPADASSPTPLARPLPPRLAKVGRFNSPFFLTPSDSIRINENPIAPALFAASDARVREVDRANEVGCTEFEILTSTAFECFAADGVDVAVVEVGLGGRLDATNVVDEPVVAVVASIGMDHVAHWGGTVELIAGEKAGIIKKGRPVVVAPQRFGGEAVLRVIREVAEKVGASRVVEVGEVPEWVEVEESKDEGPVPPLQHARYSFLGEPITFPMPLRGNMQLDNVATAIKALESIHQHGIERNDSRFQLSSADITTGIACTRWPARLQWIDDPKIGLILVDGAHNQQACEALRDYVDLVLAYRALHTPTSDSRVVWVLGLTQGKDIDAMFSTLLRPADMLLTAPFATPEGMPWISCVPPRELALASKMVSPTIRGSPYEDLGGCLAALGESREKRPLTVVCGSLYLVADVYRRLGIDV